jgi:hypothetical protein
LSLQTFLPFELQKSYSVWLFYFQSWSLGERFYDITINKTSQITLAGFKTWYFHQCFQQWQNCYSHYIRSQRKGTLNNYYINHKKEDRGKKCRHFLSHLVFLLLRRIQA